MFIKQWPYPHKQKDDAVNIAQLKCIIEENEIEESGRCYKKQIGSRGYHGR